jgi:hypothetical protein
MPHLERLRSQSVPPHSVVITVWKAAGRTVADVACTSDSMIVADFPRPVPAAVARAEELRQGLRLNRIMVALSEEGLWRKEWGPLLETQLA